MKGVFTVLALILKLTISFFAVMNPLGNIPIFITLTSDYSIQERRHSARKAVFISFIILTLFLLLGTFILFYYSTSIINKLGQNGLNVISRLMGLILAVMAIQMIAEGIHGLFPHL